MAIRASDDIAFVEYKHSPVKPDIRARQDRRQQLPATPLWWDLFSLAFEGYRRLLLLRLDWHQRVGRQSDQR